MKDAKRRAVIYARISLDLAEGAGVARQVEDCRDLAQRNGWEVVAVESDNSVSAYSAKRRPGFQTVLEHVQEGRADTVVCWHLDRLVRKAADLATVLDLRAECPTLAVVPVRGTAIYADDASGRMTAEILTSVSGYESAHKGERVSRARRQAVESGALPTRTYGYGASGTPSEPAASAVRAAFAAMLREQTIAAAQRALVAVDSAAPASRTAVRALLTRSTYAGIATYRGSERPDVQARWEPLVSTADYRRVQAILSRPARRYAKHDRGARSALLSGLLLCGRCGEPMTASTQHGGSGGARYPVYTCLTGRDHLRRKRQEMDAWTVALAMTRLGLPDAQASVLPRDPAPGADDLAARWASLRDKRSEAADLWSAGDLPTIDYQRLSGRLTADLEALEERLAHMQVSPEDGAPLPADPAFALVGVSLAGLRTVISTLLTVTAYPVGRGGGPRARPFDPGTVKIEWRTDLPPEPPGSGLAAVHRPSEEWWEEIQVLTDGGMAGAAEALVAEQPPLALSVEQRRALWAALTPAAALAADAEVD